MTFKLKEGEVNFTFFSPAKIVFGAGISKNIADHIPQPASRDKKRSEDGGHSRRTRGKVLLITGKDTSRAKSIIDSLNSSETDHELMVQSGEPSISEIVKGVEMAIRDGIDSVIAIGGGSVIDAGKAIAALTTNRHHIMHYLEIIGKGSPLTEKSLPMVAIPTTSGTGAETTCNAVLSSPEHHIKVSLRGHLMYPDVALIDPELSMSMSAQMTASTGMDALTQLIESFTSRFATPVTDALCREGLSKISGSFKKCYDEPDNIEARGEMSLAAMLSGITLSNAKLGAVHGIAGPMGGMVNAPHGLICARLLGSVITANIVMVKEQLKWAGQKESALKSLMKYQEVARILTGNPDAEPDDASYYINEIAQYMHIRDIAFPEVDSKQIDLVTRQSEKSSSMKGNPVALSSDQIKNIIKLEFSC